PGHGKLTVVMLFHPRPVRLYPLGPTVPVGSKNPLVALPLFTFLDSDRIEVKEAELGFHLRALQAYRDRLIKTPAPGEKAHSATQSAEVHPGHPHVTTG